MMRRHDGKPRAVTNHKRKHTNPYVRNRTADYVAKLLDGKELHIMPPMTL